MRKRSYILIFYSIYFINIVCIAATKDDSYLLINSGMSFHTGNLNQSQTVPAGNNLSYNEVTNKIDIKFKPGFNINLGFGGLFKKGRIGGAVGYTQANIKSFNAVIKGDQATIEDVTSTPNGKLRITELWINGYYDTKISRFFTQYVGLGLGAIWILLDVNKTDNTHSTDVNVSRFAFQIIGGVQYYLYNNFSLLLEYRFLRSSEFEFITPINKTLSFSNFKDHLTNHSINAGFQFTFS